MIFFFSFFEDLWDETRVKMIENLEQCEEMHTERERERFRVLDLDFCGVVLRNWRTLDAPSAFPFI